MYKSVFIKLKTFKLFWTLNVIVMLLVCSTS